MAAAPKRSAHSPLAAAVQANKRYGDRHCDRRRSAATAGRSKLFSAASARSVLKRGDRGATGIWGATHRQRRSLLRHRIFNTERAEQGFRRPPVALALHHSCALVITAGAADGLFLIPIYKTAVSSQHGISPLPASHGRLATDVASDLRSQDPPRNERDRFDVRSARKLASNGVRRGALISPQCLMRHARYGVTRHRSTSPKRAYTKSRRG
jgi:hypothetical protein